MKILLDEDLDWRLKRELPGHAVESAPFGWAGLKNGELLARAEGRFEVTRIAWCATGNRKFGAVAV
ncbi:MAG: hypothetical protein IH623_27975 [Verrucomicrobia bacterium]|nr:hypothetical protein [Verrucomicrobiota bacterium]